VVAGEPPGFPRLADPVPTPPALERPGLITGSIIIIQKPCPLGVPSFLRSMRASSTRGHPAEWGQEQGKKISNRANAIPSRRTSTVPDPWILINPRDAVNRAKVFGFVALIEGRQWLATSPGWLPGGNKFEAARSLGEGVIIKSESVIRNNGEEGSKRSSRAISD